MVYTRGVLERIQGWHTKILPVTTMVVVVIVRGEERTSFTTFCPGDGFVELQTYHNKVIN